MTQDYICVNNYLDISRPVATLFLLTLFVGGLVTGCQPDPGERLASAKSLISESRYEAAAVDLRIVVQAEPGNTEARLLLADASIVLADFDTAETQYARVLEMGNDRVEVWFGLGRTMLANGKAEEAFEYVLPELESRATSDAHFTLMGDILMTLGNTEAARGYYLQALDHDPESPSGTVGLAAVAAAEGDIEQAMALLDDALVANAGSQVLWRAKGNLLQATRRLGAAAEAYTAAKRLETPDTPRSEIFQTRANLVSVLIDNLSYDAAAVELRELRDRFPRHSMLPYLSGRIAFGNGDFARAQAEFQQFLSENPDDSHGQAMMGMVSFRQHNFGQAEMWLTRAIRAQVGGDAIRRLLGETKLQLNKPREALETLQAVDSEGQRDALLLAMLGRAEVGVGDTDAAIRYFEESLALDPDNSLLGIALAANYINAGRYDESTELLQRLPDIESSRHYKTALLIGTYLESGARDRAITEVERMLASNPDDPLSHAIAGTMWQSLDDTARARRHFNRLLELEPDNVAALYSLGRIDIAESNLGEALNQFQRALDIDASFVPALRALLVTSTQAGNSVDLESRIRAAVTARPAAFGPQALLVRYLLSQGRHEDAMERGEELRRQFPGDSRVDHLLGAVLLASNRPGESLQFLKRAVGSDPGNPEYLFELSNAELLSGRFNDAYKTITTFRELRPDDERGLAILTSCALGAGKEEVARREVRAYLARNPDSVPAQMMLGDLELALGNARAALQSFDRVAEQDWGRRIAMQLSIARGAAGAPAAYEPIGRWLGEHPEDDEARQLLARLLENAGETSAAVREYETLVERNGADAITLNNLAWHYNAAGNPDALQLARRAHELDPTNANVADTLGWLLLENGDADQAVEILRDAANRAGDNPEIQYHLAAALARSGDRTAAKAIVTRLLESSPSFPSRTDAERLAQSL